MMHYLNIYPKKDLHPRCCIGHCHNKCLQDTESCILLNATISYDKETYKTRTRKLIHKGSKKYKKKIKLMNDHNE